MSIPNIPHSSDPKPKERSVVDEIARRAPILSPTHIIHRTLLHDDLTHKRVGYCGANYYRLGPKRDEQEDLTDVNCEECKYMMSIEEVMSEAISKYLEEWSTAKDALPQTSKFLAQLSPKVMAQWIIQDINRSIIKRGD